MTTEINHDHRGEVPATLGRRGHAALAAARAGLFVFPVRVGAKVPAVKDWEAAATRDPAQIIRWWAHRPYNLGVATGKSGLVVIDLDHGRGETAPEPFTGCRDGREVLAQLAREAGQPAPWATYAVTTPTGGGLHLYFRAPAGSTYRNSAGRLGWHVDVRAHGGYVVAATSTRPEGTYQAVNRQAIAALPGWLAAHLDALAPAEADPDTAPLPAIVAQGRPGALVAAIVKGEIDELMATPVGQGKRHAARLKAARKLGQLVGGNALTYNDALGELLPIVHRHIGVTRSADGRITSTSRIEVERDVTDGLAYGMARPRTITDKATRGHADAYPGTAE